MRSHVDRFDERWTFKQLQLVGRMKDPSSFSPAPRVTNGHPDVLDTGAEALLKSKWDEIVTPATGMATYKDLVNEIRAAIEWEKS
mmetsp:Transcript_41475/g.50271  ORF Transcript_41475/g.50271 Transcript_41475/m.50271 type:complete len:85 (+) Transcript_41475:19-273(+)